jgi:hypothetical protein
LGIDIIMAHHVIAMLTLIVQQIGLFMIVSTACQPRTASRFTTTPPAWEKIQHAYLTFLRY